MLPPDAQRLAHIRDYCLEIRKTIERYGESFETFDSDPDYQRSVSFCILQIGELSGKLSAEYRLDTTKQIQWGPSAIVVSRMSVLNFICRLHKE